MNYFGWLIFFICQDEIERESYHKIFKKMYETDFESFIKNDDNRASDGQSLRVLYEDETGLACEKNGPCSVLEMMVALAIQCENDIMYDPDEGDRTDVWFWEMMANLGLDQLDNTRYNEAKAKRILYILNARAYGTDGYGGPFYIKNFDGDMREIELWYQLNYWLDECFE